jgi:hypothetical protein
VNAEAVSRERQASWLELFFDLVLVAAVAAQLHHAQSLRGLAVFAGLFVPVWWIWWGFTWYSSAFNDDDAVNRLALLVAMVASGRSSSASRARRIATRRRSRSRWRASSRCSRCSTRVRGCVCRASAR